MEKTYIKWDEFHKDCDKVAINIASNNPSPDYMICLSRGGVVPGRIMAEIVKPKRFLVLGVKLFEGMERGNNVQITQDISELTETDRHDRVLIVDDISDKGTTLRYAYSYLFKATGGAHLTTACPYIKNGTSLVPTYYSRSFSDDEWVVFPFEKD